MASLPSTQCQLYAVWPPEAEPADLGHISVPVTDARVPSRPAGSAVTDVTWRGTPMIPNGYDVRVLVTASPSYGHVNPCLRRAAGGPRGGARHRQGADGARRHGLTVWEVGCGRAESDARFRAARPDLEALALDERLVRLVEGCSSRPRPSALRTCSPGSSGGGPTWSCTKSASWRVGECDHRGATPGPCTSYTASGSPCRGRCGPRLGCASAGRGRPRHDLPRPLAAVAAPRRRRYLVRRSSDSPWPRHGRAG